jgi:DNA-binding LytR/AlgR family response regulator
MDLRIIDKNKSLNFRYNGEIYKIPFKDILYIERDTDIDISIIHTKNREIEINKTINELEDILRYENAFLKTHRSCIVNTSRINKVDWKNSIIEFSTGDTIDLISRDRKKGLKKYVGC